MKDDSPLWNSSSGEQLDLGRVGIPRGKGRQVVKYHHEEHEGHEEQE